MKKIFCLVISLIVVIFLMVGCSSTGLSGKYVDKDNRTLQFTSNENLNFNGNEGTYSIDDEKITFIFSGRVQEYSFSKVADSIVIDGIEYKKTNK